jgi:hypothetical protein
MTSGSLLPVEVVQISRYLDLELLDFLQRDALRNNEARAASDVTYCPAG